LGPINVAKLKFPAQQLKGRMAVAELWLYPDGSRIFELSTKCLPGESFAGLAATRALLMSRASASRANKRQRPARRWSILRASTRAMGGSRGRFRLAGHVLDQHLSEIDERRSHE